MAFKFNQYVQGLPNAGISTNYGRMASEGTDPSSFLPGYRGGLETLNNINVIGTAGAIGAQPVVLNNMQYAQDYMDYVGGLQDYSRMVGNVNQYATGLQMLDPVYGSQNFAYGVSPGTATGQAMRYGVASANPYLGIGTGINNLTANKANPYGAIPGFSHLNQASQYVTDTLNNTAFATGIRNIASDAYNSTLGRVMDNDVGRNIHNLASMPMNAVTGTTNLLREGYQALDRNVFGNLLPGGADAGDAESLRFDNPYSNLQENIKKIGERKDEIVAEKFYSNFNDIEKQLAERFEEKGFSKTEVVDIIKDQGGGALERIQDFKVEGNPDFGGLTKEEMSRVTQLLNEETERVFKDGSDLPEATITPDFKLEGITQADLDALEAKDARVLRDLGVNVKPPTPVIDTSNVANTGSGLDLPTYDYNSMVNEIHRNTGFNDFGFNDFGFDSSYNFDFGLDTSFNASNNFSDFTSSYSPTFDSYNLPGPTMDFSYGSW